MTQKQTMPLPKYFCWTRFGTEAGQSIDQIFARKEQERIANAGIFFWGVGNAIGPSMLELLRRTESPEALFSPVRSSPRREDASPCSVVAWTEATTLSGEDYQLPQHSLITSRFDPLNPRANHYALVCNSESQITAVRETEQIQFAQLRNLLTNRPLGASQVTAVVCSSPMVEGKGNSYDVAFRAQLALPYFIRLRNPVPLLSSGHHDGWAEIVRRTWDSKIGAIAVGD